jgi:hypothetical protein
MWIVFECGEKSLRNFIEMGTHLQESEFLDLVLNVAEGIMDIHA